MYNDYLKANNLTDNTEYLKNECIQEMLATFRELTERYRYTHPRIIYR